MSALWWLLWAAVAAALVWQVRRALREPSERDRVVRDALGADTPVPPAPDNEPGINLADHDECELILSLPEYGLAAAAIDEGLARLFEHIGPPPACDPSWDAGCERLWDAIRDDQKGDQA